MWIRFLYLAVLVALYPLQGYQTHYAPHVEVDGRIGGFRNGGGAIGWIPLRHDDNRVIFTQLAGGYYLDQYVGTVGLGYRQVCNCNLGWGINGFADFSRSSVHHKSYAQGGVGVELFGACWDARANAYFPTANRKFLGLQLRESFAVMTDDGVNTENIFSRRVAQAFYGGDVEVGLRRCLCGFELRGYGGYYAYDASGVKVVQGPRVRGEVRKEGFIFPQLSLRVGGEWQTDRIHSNDVSLLIGASWDFGRCKPRCCCQSVCSYLGERVYRQPAPWVLTALEEKRISQIEDIFIFFVAEGGTGPGTQLDPTNIQDVQTLAGIGDIIILLNDNGTIVPTATFMMEASQQLGGFLNNPSIVVTLLNGQEVTVPNLNMSGPALLQPAANTFDLIQLADSNNLFNFETSGGMAAITGTGFSGLTVDSLTLAGSVTSGIDFTTPMGTITVTNTTLTPATGATAVLVSGGSATANLAGLTIMSTGNAGSTGIDVQSTTGGGYTFGPTTLTDHGVDAIFFSGNAATFTFNSTTINDTTGGDGIDMTNQTGNVTFTAGTMTQSGGGSALVSSGGTATVNLAGFTIGNTDGAPGINVQNTTGGSYTFGPTTLTDNTTDAIFLSGNAAAFTFNNTTISDSTGSDGIDMLNQTGNVTFATGTLTLTGGGIAVNSSGGSAAVNLAGLTISATGGNTGIEVQNTTGGSYTFGPTTLTNQAVDSITLSSNVAAFTFNNTTISSNTIGRAIMLNSQAGNVTFTTGTVTQTGGGRVFVVLGGSGAFDLSGLTILNTILFPFTPIDIQNMTGGSVMISNATITNTTVTAAALLLSANASAITLDNVDVTGGTFATAVLDATGNTNSITYQNSNLTPAASGANGVVLTNNSATTLFDNVDITGPFTTAAVSAMTPTGTFTYQNSMISNTDLTGDGIIVTDAGTALSTVTSNTFATPLGGAGSTGMSVLFSNTAATTTNVTLTSNSEGGEPLNPSPTYQFFQSNVLSVMNITVTGNSGARIGGGAGIDFANSGSMPGLTLAGVNAANIGMSTPATGTVP